MNDLPHDDEVRAWALAEIEADASDDVRVAALKAVRRHEWVPSQSESLAIGILLGRSRRPVETFAHEAAYSANEDAYCRAIEDFAHGFFQTPPADRRRRWDELWRGVALYPWWRSRLTALKPGLDVVIADDPASRELAEQLAGVFVQPKGTQAAQRRQLFDRLRKTKGSRQLVASLKSGQPALYGLIRNDLDRLWGPSLLDKVKSRLFLVVVGTVLGLVIVCGGAANIYDAARGRTKKPHPIDDAAAALRAGRLDEVPDAMKPTLEGASANVLGKAWVLQEGFLEPDGWTKPDDWTHPEIGRYARWFRPK